MKQTEETKKAIKRDNYRCQWCLHEGRIRESRTGHHIFGRARVDLIDGIITLCYTCHDNTHNARRPTREDLIQIMPQARKFIDLDRR